MKLLFTTLQHIFTKENNTFRFLYKSIALMYLLLILFSIISTPSSAYFVSEYTYEEILPEIHVPDIDTTNDENSNAIDTTGKRVENELDSNAVEKTEKHQINDDTKEQTNEFDDIDKNDRSNDGTEEKSEMDNDEEQK